MYKSTKSMSMLFATFLILHATVQHVSAADIKFATAKSFDEISTITLAFAATYPGTKIASFWDIDDNLVFYDKTMKDADKLTTQFFLASDTGFRTICKYLTENNGVQKPIRLMYLSVADAHKQLTPFCTLTEKFSVLPTLDLFTKLEIQRFGLTSRSWPLVAATEEQLRTIGISFSTPYECGLTFDPEALWPEILLNNDHSWKALLSPKGVIYCSGNNKGVILETALSLFKSIYNISWNSVEVVDNDPAHLNKIAQQLSTSNAVNHVLLIHYAPVCLATEPSEIIPEIKDTLDLVSGLDRELKDKAPEVISSIINRQTVRKTPARTNSCPLLIAASDN